MYKALLQLVEGYIAVSEEDKALITEAFKRAKAKGFSFQTAFEMAIHNRKEFLELIKDA